MIELTAYSSTGDGDMASIRVNPDHIARYGPILNTVVAPSWVKTEVICQGTLFVTETVEQIDDMLRRSGHVVVRSDTEVKSYVE